MARKCLETLKRWRTKAVKDLDRLTRSGCEEFTEDMIDHYELIDKMKFLYCNEIGSTRDNMEINDTFVNLNNYLNGVNEDEDDNSEEPCQVPPQARKKRRRNEALLPSSSRIGINEDEGDNSEEPSQVHPQARKKRRQNEALPSSSRTGINEDEIDNYEEPSQVPSQIGNQRRCDNAFPSSSRVGHGGHRAAPSNVPNPSRNRPILNRRAERENEMPNRVDARANLNQRRVTPPSRNNRNGSPPMREILGSIQNLSESLRQPETKTISQTTGAMLGGLIDTFLEQYPVYQLDIMIDINSILAKYGTLAKHRN